MILNKYLCDRDIRVIMNQTLLWLNYKYKYSFLSKKMKKEKIIMIKLNNKKCLFCLFIKINYLPP